MKKVFNKLLLVALLANASAFANAPTGLQLDSAAGAAITNSSAIDATIRQTVPKQILDWQTFNLGNGDALQFNQLGDRNWASLNRINSIPTPLFGKSVQDKKLYLTNDSGILFPDGNAEIGCSSTLSISASNGLPISCSGDLSFLSGVIRDNQKISLISTGSINVGEGASLVAPQVELQPDSIGDHTVLASDPISLSGLRGAGVFYSGEFLVRPYIPEKVVDTSLEGSISLGGSTPLILAVPEPSTYLMMLLGLVGIVGVARRKA